MGKRNRALRGKQTINPDNLAPGIAAGLTQGVSKEEVMRDLAAQASAPSGVESIRHMNHVEHVGRVPLPKFVPDETPSDLVVIFPDGRAFREVEKMFQPDVIAAMRGGMICLRCLEPQAEAFGDDHLPGCEGVAMHGTRYMRDRMILDLNMEMRDGKHLGPAKPMSEYLDEQAIRAERARFDAKIAEGGSKGRRRG